MSTPLLEETDWDRESIPTWEIKPVCIGPSWQRTEGWTPGDDPMDEFVLPELTLGWQILKWIPENLLGDDGGPFQLTSEQSRFILWWYAVDEYGHFSYRDGVLQRLKGWG